MKIIKHNTLTSTSAACTRNSDANWDIWCNISENDSQFETKRILVWMSSTYEVMDISEMASFDPLLESLFVNFDPLGNKGADKLWTWSHCTLRIPSSPLDISKLVTVCHLFMATNQEFFWRRQLRSMTSCSLPIKLLNWWSLSIENSPEGNSHDVTMTWNYNVKAI